MRLLPTFFYGYASLDKEELYLDIAKQLGIYFWIVTRDNTQFEYCIYYKDKLLFLKEKAKHAKDF